ncbi:MAG: hypothetical protein QNJ98_00285 [Planctomycetota bacterium]|nr:hypothetical protein [Planctomycetota bacterium]
MRIHRSVLTGLLVALLLLSGTAYADELADFGEVWDFRDVPATEKRFRALLESDEAKADLSYRLQVQTQLARTLGLQKKFDAAHAVLDGVEQALTKDTPFARVRYGLERGRTLNSSKQAAKAMPLFEAAWDLAREIKAHGLAVDAAHMLGIAAPDTKGKLAWNVKAMEYAEASKAPRAMRWLGALYNNIGWTYHEAKQYEKALEVHTKGWLWRQARAPDSRSTRIAKWSVAKQLRELGRAHLALAMQRELLAVYEQLEQEDGFVYEEIGECLLLLDRKDEATPWFAKAWNQLKDMGWIRDSEPERLPRIKRLGGVKDETPADK